MKSTASPRRAQGFTLVELMVGVLIGLIGTVVIFQVFAVSEGQKRTTTGAGDALQNGVFSLFQIERDLRMAGFGINHLPLLGCVTNGYYEPTGTNFSFNLLPVEIANGAAGTPDTITVAYGDADLFSTPEKLLIDMPDAASPYRVKNRFGFRPGDVLIAAQNGSPCSLGQVSGNPVVLDVPHASGAAYLNPKGQGETTRFNRAGGLAAPGNIAYTKWVDATSTGGRLFNLGQRPSVIRYSIVNSQLVAQDLLQAGAAGSTVVLADGIVQFQAQYGFDGNGDGSVSAAAPVNAVAVIAGTPPPDQWVDSMPAAATAADWQKVIAVRIVAVSRSITPERRNTANACVTTVANPVWAAGGNVPLDVSLWDPVEWGCYRYRAFEVVVPLRNMVWFPQPA